MPKELPDPSLKYDMPSELLSDERLEASRREQLQLAEKVNSPYSSKSPQDIQRFNAGILIAETEQMLLAIPLKKLNWAAREQYAEALAEVGEYEKAAQATTDKDRRKVYKDIWKAVNLDDLIQCKCPKGNRDGTHNQYAELEVWSQKHGKRMPIIKCNICGHRNVRKLPEHIAKARELRKKVISHVTGKTHSDAKQIMNQILK